jgi:DNA-binding NarL/FixJ family response regulator
LSSMSHDKNHIKLAIVDDHPVVIQGVQNLLSNEPRISITGCFSAGADLVAFIKKNPIDIALLDVALPDISGPELCKLIKEASPSTCILAFSSYSERAVIMQLLQSGASGYLLKNVSAEELLRCIDEALGGGIAFSAEVQKIITRPSATELKSIPPLTKREKQVLKLIAEGKTNTDIASALMLSILTVETHRKNLMRKFEAKNGATLIKIAMEQQLL